MWAFGGGGLVFGFISFIVITLIPALVAAILLVRRSPWKDGPVGPTGPSGADGSNAVYTADGTLQSGAHIVAGTAGFIGCGGVSACATVTFIGSAVYSTNSSYVCTVTEVSASPDNETFTVEYVSGSMFTIRDFSGIRGGVVSYICAGT